jgi:hypothetical protein
VGEVVTGIDADLLPGAMVEGEVRVAGSGAPFRWVRVCAWRLNGKNAGCGLTDADGTYSMQALPTDEYRIEFSPINSGWRTQFWDHKSRLDQADPLSVEAGTTTTGIDADIQLISEPQLPVLAPSPLAMPPLQLQSSPSKPRHCRKGLRRKRVRGTVRCVRKHKRRHRRHRHHSRRR